MRSKQRFDEGIDQGLRRNVTQSYTTKRQEQAMKRDGVAILVGP